MIVRPPIYTKRLKSGSKSSSETVLGAKILLFNRFANNAPRRASGRRVRKFFFTIVERKVHCPWWYQWAGAISPQTMAKQDFFCFRLVERSRSTVSFSCTSSHGSWQSFYSCHIFWAGSSPSKGQKTLRYSRSSLDIERWSYLPVRRHTWIRCWILTFFVILGESDKAKTRWNWFGV